MNQLLVIEDDPSIRESLVDYFGGRDWLVRACGDRKAAQRALGEQRFHMVGRTTASGWWMRSSYRTTAS